MAIRMLVMGLALALCLGELACEKLPDEAVRKASRQLKIDSLPSLEAIPTDYGNIVGVTSSSGTPSWAQLWFEKPDKTITVVWVNFIEGGLRREFVSIPRR